MKWKEVIAVVLGWLSQINFTVWHNLSFLETLWLLANGHGWWYSNKNYKDAKASYLAALAPPKDEIAADLAELTMFIHKCLRTGQMIFFMLGLMAAILIPPAQVEAVRAGTNVFITVGLVGVAFLFDYMSWRVHKYREDIFAKRAKEKANEVLNRPAL